jgi:hypothetical protein
MKGSNFVWAVILLNVGLSIVIGIKRAEIKDQKSYINAVPEATTPVIQDRPKIPETPNISVKIPNYLEYPDIINQVKKWCEEAPDLVETGFYGKTRKNKDIVYIRLTNKLNSQEKPVVLLTAAIHGNEPWSTGCMMAYSGMLLSEYGKNSMVTDLLNTRDIFIVPVVSPDSYSNSREVDGIDPNRDFPSPNRPDHISSPSIVAIQDFFLKIKPKAVISGHAFGRVFLTPYGDTKNKCPNESDYQEIIGQMSKMSKYRIDRTCNNYGNPILGTEVDWYYRNGAFSVVMEFGTHQAKPNEQQINEEYGKTWEAILYFLKYAPLVEIKAGEDFDFLNNKGISGRFLPLLKDDYAQLGP